MRRDKTRRRYEARRISRAQMQVLTLVNGGMKQQVHSKVLGRNDPCWCGSGQKYKKCHMTNDQHEPRQVTAPAMESSRQARSATLIKTPEQIEGIRKASRLARETLDMLEERIRPGVTTGQIDQWVHALTLERGAYPATLNYKGYPKSVCTSVNEVVCHGIPGNQILQEGDIVNVDVTSILNGYYGDTSRMYLLGQVDQEAQRLVRVAKECMERGIAQVRPGGFVGDIGQAIQAHAEANGFSVVRDFVGHGTGVQFHEDPQIPHFGRSGQGHPLLPGMVFTIEPMINAGDWRVSILKDKWTAVTKDHSLSAQWEHTVLVTPEGVEVLTA